SSRMAETQRPYRARLRGPEEHLAEVLARLDERMGLRGLGERKRAVHDRLEVAGLDAREDRGELVAEERRLLPEVPHVHAEDADVAVHEAERPPLRDRGELLHDLEHRALGAALGHLRVAEDAHAARRREELVALLPAL